ncbi:hypothetical protein EV379_2367 [Microterricola gilva]|uniref:Uncharacterized protein n=1 Tax=Microterricola gilva TaxID=393267 RepID=A0A4Q8AN26_9MICO|nr:hypothetical protein [Microterricola gilva]RZU66022.1 hypothetical protein EV379_2367 [Microterricola gilva]
MSIDSSYEKPEEKDPGRPLEEIFADASKRARISFRHSWERAELVAQTVSQLDERFITLADSLSTIEAPAFAAHHLASDQGMMHTLSLNTQGSSDRLFIAVPPYDTAWTTFQPPGAAGTQARGPSADKTRGSMSIDLIETYVDRPVAEDGWMYAGAGIGVWFKPKSPSTYVRVSALTSYDYDWADSSSLQVAHNRAQICKLVLRWVGPGQLETVLDRRDQLWNDGTGWYEDHSDSQNGYWSNQDYFWASSNEWYLVWIWCNGGIDFATKTTFGSSKARQTWRVRVPLIVFEEWA